MLTICAVPVAGGGALGCGLAAEAVDVGSAAEPDPDGAVPRHPTADNVIRTISPATSPWRYRTKDGGRLLVWSGGVLHVPVPMSTTQARMVAVDKWP